MAGSFGFGRVTVTCPRRWGCITRLRRFIRRALCYLAARTRGAEFRHADYRESFAEAREGDLIYCDPPYTHSQTILYGAQAFSLPELMASIADAKSRGVRVALSIDGKKSDVGGMLDLPIPEGLFQRQAMVNVGRSMLKRFQMGGQSLENHVVSDRLLLTY